VDILIKNEVIRMDITDQCQFVHMTEGKAPMTKEQFIETVINFKRSNPKDWEEMKKIL